MPRKLFLIIFGIAVMTAVLQASFTKSDIKVHRLDNGLKIIFFEDHKIPSISYYTFFRVGSRNERPGLTGVSHFIEHMMFNGTAKFGPGEFDRIMEFYGGGQQRLHQRRPDRVHRLVPAPRPGKDGGDGSRPDAGSDLRPRGL